MNSRDKLTPVVSEQQLKPGVLVRLVDCRCCPPGSAHRTMILGAVGRFVYRQGPGIGYKVAPEFPCDRGALAPPSFDLAIRDGRLFIVDTGLDEKQDAIKEAVVQKHLKKIKLDI